MNIFLLDPHIQQEITEGDAGDYVEEDSAETGMFIMVSKTFVDASQFMTFSLFIFIFSGGLNPLLPETPKTRISIRDLFLKRLGDQALMVFILP